MKERERNSRSTGVNRVKRPVSECPSPAPSEETHTMTDASRGLTSHASTTVPRKEQWSSQCPGWGNNVKCKFSSHQCKQKMYLAHTIFINYKYIQHLAMYHWEVELLSGRIFPQTTVREIYSWKVWHPVSSGASPLGVRVFLRSPVPTWAPHCTPSDSRFPAAVWHKLHTRLGFHSYWCSPPWQSLS